MTLVIANNVLHQQTFYPGFNYKQFVISNCY